MAAHVLGVQPLSLPQKADLALEILGDYCRVRWHLLRDDLPAVVERLRATPRRLTPGDDSGERLVALTGLRLGKVVVRTLRVLPTDSRCLMRSLVLTSVLERRGIRTSLVMAVRPAPKFTAHAWIEYDGIPLLAPGDPGYEQLTRI